MQSKLYDVFSILTAVAKVYNITVDDILRYSTKSSTAITEVRFMATFFLRKHTVMSFKEIGGLFKKDHSTAMYYAQNHSTMACIYQKYKNKELAVSKILANEN